MARTKETARKASGGGGGPRDAFGGKPLPRGVYGGKPAPPMTSGQEALRAGQEYREGRRKVARKREGDERARKDRKAQAQAQSDDRKNAPSLLDANHEADSPGGEHIDMLLVNSKTASRHGQSVMTGKYNDLSFVGAVLDMAQGAREARVEAGLEDASEMDDEEEEMIIEDAEDLLGEYREQRSEFMRKLGEVLDVLVDQSREEFLEEYRALMGLKKRNALPTEPDSKAMSNIMMFEQSRPYAGYTPQVVPKMEERIVEERQALEKKAEGEDKAERERKLKWFQEASSQALVRATVRFWQNVELQEGAPSVVPQARGGGGKVIQPRMSGKGLDGGKGVKADDLDVSTDGEDEEEYLALVNDFREEKERSKFDIPDLDTLVRLEKMKPRTHRGNGRLIAPFSPYLSPQPWSPSYQFPMQPLTMLEADVVGSLIFGDVVFDADDKEKDADTWRLAYDTDGVELPDDGWHSWRRHFRDAMLKLQAEGYLQGGKHKMLKKKPLPEEEEEGEGGDVDMGEGVVAAPQKQRPGYIETDGEQSTLPTFFVRAAVEFSTTGSLDVFSRADDPLYEVDGPKFWPQQLSISVEQLQKEQREKEKGAGKQVTIAKDVAEYRVYENLKIADVKNNTLRPQELVALRYFPQHWEYYVMTKEERETRWGGGSKTELDLEDEQASDLDVSIAHSKMFDFVSRLQRPEVDLFAAPVDESTGAEEPARRPREWVPVVVESGDLMTVQRKAEVAIEMLRFRTQQLAEVENSVNDQRRAHNEMLNKEQENGLKLSYSLLEHMQLNQSLADTVRAQKATLRIQKAELDELKAASLRPSTQGDAAHPQFALAAASSGGQVDRQGWSPKEPISGWGPFDDLELDVEKRKELVGSSQALFDNAHYKAFRRDELAAARMKRKLDFWKKMMRVRDTDWRFLIEGKLYFDFLNAKDISRRAKYALYEVVVLNISPDADGVYKGGDGGPMNHDGMVQLEGPVDPWPIGSDPRDLPMSAQRRAFARKPASKGAGSSASGDGDGDGTPATAPVLAPIVGTPCNSPTPPGEPSAGSPTPAPPSAGDKRPSPSRPPPSRPPPCRPPPSGSRKAAAMRSVRD